MISHTLFKKKKFERKGIILYLNTSCWVLLFFRSIIQNRIGQKMMEDRKGWITKYVLFFCLYEQYL